MFTKNNIYFWSIDFISIMTKGKRIKVIKFTKLKIKTYLLKTTTTIATTTSKNKIK